MWAVFDQAACGPFWTSTWVVLIHGPF